MVGHSPSPLMSPCVPAVPPCAMALPGVDGMGAISPASRFLPTSPSPTYCVAEASAAAADVNELGEGTMDFSAEASSTATDEMTESLNPASRHRLRFWRKIVAPGEPEISRNKHGAVVHEDRMYVFGGYCQENKSFLDEILMYDFVNEEWTVLPNICETDESDESGTGGSQPVVSTPTTAATSFSTATGTSAQKGIRCRRAHSMTVYEDGLFVFGGFDGHTCLNDLWRLDLRSYKWRLLEVVGELPCQRGGHSAVLRGEQLIIHGGWDVGNVYFNDTHYIDLSPSTRGLPCQSVRALPVGDYVPQGRVGHSCVLVSDTQMLMFGGYGGQQYWDDLNLFDMTTQEWCRLEASSEVQPSQRTFSTMERCGHRVLLVGGSDHTKEMNDVMIFDLQRNEWQAVECMGDIPEGRFAHSTVVYKHKVYLYGGITQNSPTIGLYELTLESFSVEDSLRNLVKMFMVGSGIDYTKYEQALPPNVWKDLNSYQKQVTQMLEWEAAMAAKAEIEAVEEALPMEEDPDEEVEDSGDLDVEAELPDVESVLNATTSALIQTLPMLSTTPNSMPVQQPPPYLYSVGQPASIPAPLSAVQTPLSGPSTFVNWGEPTLHTPDAGNFVPAFAHAAYHHAHPTTPGTVSAAPSTPLLVRCGMSFAGVAPSFGRLDSEIDGFGFGMSASVDVMMDEAEESSDEEWELNNEDDDWGARDAEVPFFPAPGTPSTASRRSLYSPARSMPATPYTPGGTPSLRRTFSSLPASPASPGLFPTQLSFPSPYFH